MVRANATPRRTHQRQRPSTPIRRMAKSTQGREASPSAMSVWTEACVKTAPPKVKTAAPRKEAMGDVPESWKSRQVPTPMELKMKISPMTQAA